eukprot:6173349-Pleurochrysis_carterae.AAC.2
MPGALCMTASISGARTEAACTHRGTTSSKKCGSILDFDPCIAQLCEIGQRTCSDEGLQAPASMTVPTSSHRRMLQLQSCSACELWSFSIFADAPAISFVSPKVSKICFDPS